MDLRRIASILLVGLLAPTLIAQTSVKRHKGTLILSGAGSSRESFGTGVIERFVLLAGGPDANLVYIPTAET